MNDIFTIENDLLVIDKDYVRGISEFRVILERDRGSKGDQDGRKKFQAFKEFFYIYVVASLFSYPNKGGYNEKATHEAAVKEAKLEEGFKPDKEIKAAIEKYREIQKISLPTLSIINSVVRALRVGETITAGIINSMEDTIEIQERIRKEKKDAGEPADIANDLLTVNGLVEQLTQVMKISSKLPDTIETLQGLEERLKKEMSGDNLARGGKKVANRADPKPRG